MKRILPFILLAIWSAACGSGNGSGGADAGADAVSPDSTESSDAVPHDVEPEDLAEPDDALPEEVEADVGPPPVECTPNPGTLWSPGVKIFKEVTADWGLIDLAVQGFRINATDYDGDGWTDLIVRWGGGVDDFSPGGDRSFWLLRNTGAGKFEDVTKASGIVQTRYGDDDNLGRPGEIIAGGDLDNDGDLDFVLANTVHDPNAAVETSEVFLNNGDGTFSLGPEENGYRQEGMYTVPAGVTLVDFDRDGFLDIWTVNNMVSGMSQPLPDKLFKGDGTGAFTDVSEQMGIETMPWLLPPDNLNNGLGHSWAWGSTACDLNNDGVPELLTASYGRCPNHLWQGVAGQSGLVTYENVSVYSGYAYDDRMDWSDNESAQCWCKLHPDDDECEGVPGPTWIKCQVDADAFRWNHATDREPWRLAGNSATTTCADVNNDGFIDLMTGEIVHWDVGSSSDPAELVVNTGEADVRFERPGNEVTGLTKVHPDINGDGEPGPVWDDGDMTNTVFDFDNDGWLDIHVASSDYPYTLAHLYHQESPETFLEVGTEDFFEHLRNHGVTAADFDRDGDLDVLVGHSKMRCGGQYLDDCYETLQVRLFENILGDAGNWVQISVEGADGSNRSAIGAQVSVATPDGVTRKWEVDGGHGHFGTQRDMVQHFGLGDECLADVTIRWPDQDLTIQQFQVAGNHRYKVVQGEPPVPADP